MWWFPEWLAVTQLWLGFWWVERQLVWGTQDGSTRLCSAPHGLNYARRSAGLFLMWAGLRRSKKPAPRGLIKASHRVSPDSKGWIPESPYKGSEGTGGAGEQGWEEPCVWMILRGHSSAFPEIRCNTARGRDGQFPPSQSQICICQMCISHSSTNTVIPSRSLSKTHSCTYISTNSLLVSQLNPNKRMTALDASELSIIRNTFLECSPKYLLFNYFLHSFVARISTLEDDFLHDTLGSSS